MGKIGQKQVWAKVLDFTVQDYLTRDVLFQVKYAQDVAVGSEYEKLEIKGGSDNEVQATIFHSPTAKFTANLPLIDDNVIMVKTGAVKQTGAQLNSFEKVYTIGASTGTVELDISPKAGTLKVYNTDPDENLGIEIKVGTPITEPETYSITDKTLTFNDAKKGKQVIVVCDYITGENAEGLKFVSGKLPKLIRITAKTKAEDKGGKAAVKTIVVDKAKSDPTFNFETSAGNATVLPFECEVFGWTNEDGDSQFFRLVTDEDLEV